MPYGLLLLSFLGTCSLQAGLGQSAGLGLGEAQLRYGPLRRTPRNGCPNGLRCRRTLPKSRMKGRKWDGRRLLPKLSQRKLTIHGQRKISCSFLKKCNAIKTKLRQMRKLNNRSLRYKLKHYKRSTKKFFCKRKRKKRTTNQVGIKNNVMQKGKMTRRKNNACSKVLVNFHKNKCRNINRSKRQQSGSLIF